MVPNNSSVRLRVARRGGLFFLAAVMCTSPMLKAADLTVAINPSAGRLAVSPYLYGINCLRVTGAAQRIPADARFTWYRMGGNATSGYNWELNATNAGTDWGPNWNYDWPDINNNAVGGMQTGTVDLAFGRNAAAMLTIQTMGRVAADKLGTSVTSGDVAARTKLTRAFKGATLSDTPDPNDGYVNTDEFVRWITNRYSASVGGSKQILFTLDNEVDNWSNKHPVFHPAQQTYVEITDKVIDYARAVKSQAPTALVYGPVNLNIWTAKTLSNAPDMAGKGEFWTYMLDRLKSAETTYGTRLLDVATLHYYSNLRVPGEGNKDITEASNSDEAVALRVRATRSLWDSTYSEDSWLRDVFTDGVKLYPRMKAYVAASYPGTKLGITEYDFGGDDHISGAIANVDMVGVGMREGLHSLCWWPLKNNDGSAPVPEIRYGLGAYRMFRNYDNASGQVGDTYVSTTASNLIDYSAYGLAQSTDVSKSWIVLINKATTAKTAAVTISSSTNFTQVQAYLLSAAENDGLPVSVTAPAITSNAFTYSMPALSVTTIALSAVGSPPPANLPPAVVMTAPVTNAAAIAPASFALAATATDTDGTIAKVEFFNGATKLGEDTTAPYQFTWLAVPVGNYSLTARASDNVGAQTTSAAVNVSVSSAPVPVPVPGAPVITVDLPATKSVNEGGTATFAITATGSGLTYQWRRNGAAITGATSATYILSGATSSDHGAIFTVVITGSVLPSVTSSETRLSVVVTGGGTGTPPTSTGADESGTSNSGSGLCSIGGLGVYLVGIGGWLMLRRRGR